MKAFLTASKEGSDLVDTEYGTLPKVLLDNISRLVGEDWMAQDESPKTQQMIELLYEVWLIPRAEWDRHSLRPVAPSWASQMP